MMNTLKDSRLGDLLTETFADEAAIKVFDMKGFEIYSIIPPDQEVVLYLHWKEDNLHAMLYRHSIHPKAWIEIMENSPDLIFEGQLPALKDGNPDFAWFVQLLRNWNHLGSPNDLPF